MAADGRLVIVEDNAPSDIWLAGDTDGDGVLDKVDLFATRRTIERRGPRCTIARSTP
jgi:hypothetical protein